ncbi:hypothetical protein RB600_008578 [Gaeumannomyces tritici]
MLAASLCRSPRSLRLTGTVAGFRGPSHTNLGSQPGPTRKARASLQSLARARSARASERHMSGQPDAANHPEHQRYPGRPTRSLAGRVALVTGAGSRADDGREGEEGFAGLGNGAATAVLLAEAGASVVCVDILPARAERTTRLVRLEHQQRGGGRGLAGGDARAHALALAGDVTVAPDCERLIAETVGQLGRLDILVNIVGTIGVKGDATEVDPAEWARSLELNVSSMMQMAKYAIPAMRRNNDADQQQSNSSNNKVASTRSGAGSIINIGSVAGLRGGTPHLLYPTSKGAVVNMTRAMAVHHARHGIRVNCVCPGMLYTPMVAYGGDDSAHHERFTVTMSPQMRESRRNRSLLRTEGNAWDCATAVRFLAGDEARWITGSVLTVDAGATASTELVW